MSKRLLAVMVGLALLFSTVHVAISADASAPAPMNPKVKAMVDTAKAAIKKVPAEAAKTAIDTKEKAIFLDVPGSGGICSRPFSGRHEHLTRYPGVYRLQRDSRSERKDLRLLQDSGPVRTGHQNPERPGL